MSADELCKACGKPVQIMNLKGTGACCNRHLEKVNGINGHIFTASGGRVIVNGDDKSNPLTRIMEHFGVDMDGKQYVVRDADA